VGEGVGGGAGAGEIVMSERVIVVGGGLAGITAALRCADAGRQVTLLEGRPRLGGMTYSFSRGDLDVDNGQHVFLRCCTAYQTLLARLGVADQVFLQDRLDIPVRSAHGGRTARLRRTRLPAPLHLGSALARYRLVSPAQRLRFVLAALKMRHIDRFDPAIDARSFGDWLRAQGQDAQTIDALWDLVGVATLNAGADQASLAQAAMVFQVGLLTDAGAADIGWSLVPLSRLHGDAAGRALAAAGVDVRTQARVKAVEARGIQWAVDDGHETHVADDLVLAVPPPAAEALAPEGALDAPPGWSASLGSSPILNLHIVLDRRVLDEPFVAGVGTPIQWVFDRTRQSGLRPDHQYLAVSVSAADEYVSLPVAELRDRLVPDLCALLPSVGDAQILDFFVTRERDATFRPAPGSGALRLPAVTGAPGLFVAGAWTDTGWPATMEGAVRSGNAAADAVLHRPVRQGVAV
jgi:squalene-associated FAD-dependent desaturase